MGDDRLNIDIGQQSMGGADGIVLGDLSTDRSCERENNDFILKDLDDGGTNFQVKSSTTEEAWVIVATDSAFERFTRLYFESLSLALTPL